MEHRMIPLFPLPLTVVDVDCEGVAEFFDSTILPTAGKKNTDGTSGYRTALSHFHNDENVFEIYSELKDFGDRILEAANFAYREVMNRDSVLRVTNAWFNLCEVGGRQYMHNHCNSVLSGTVYLRTDNQSYLQFQSPYHMNDFGNMLLDEPNTKRPNRFGYKHYFPTITFPVEQHTCVFWPSHLRHGYQENRTPNRLSLSFNFLPETFNCVYKA
jgi:uncharacterized protein (TIGR02466 family)